jgi:polyhydroxybutyrate depolymerase
MVRRALTLSFSMALSACASPLLDDIDVRAPGDHHASFEHDGFDREVIVHVPPAQEGAAPLVLMLHGGGSSASEMAEVTGMSAVADREGFVVAYPNAVGIVHGMWGIWNTGDCFAPSCLQGVDDVDMVAALAERIASKVPIDDARVYLVGYSNGGALAFQIAARMSERFAGLAVFAATMSADGPVLGPRFREGLPIASLSVLTIHGDLDPYIGPDGREDHASTEPSLAHVTQFWAVAARCPAGPRRYLEEGGAVRVTHYQGCREDTEVKHLELSGWAHEWPGPANIEDCKDPSDPLARFDAAEAIWAFFSRHARAVEN